MRPLVQFMPGLTVEESVVMKLQAIAAKVTIYIWAGITGGWRK
jgi:hypothetical protein